ncbi:MAG: sulfatase-like hydrolase/transferase [Elusimicrobia bacterium]|nr:sulfatase-like hydrolase/transferase [Candidatus Obscuribacterium magneticum]
MNKKLAPPANTAALFIFLFTNVILFMLFRMAFLIRYQSHLSNSTASEMFRVFLNGLRFDFATACFLVLPIWALAFFKRDFKNNVKNVAALPAELFLFWAALSGFLIDIIYYDVSGRRLSYEIFFLKTDLREMLIMFGHYTLGLILFLVLCGLLTAAWWLIQRKAAGCFRGLPPKGFINRLVWQIVALLFLLVGFRGGFQTKPLKPSHAFITSQTFLAHVSLNPIFCVIHSLKKGSPYVPDVLPQPEAITITQNLVRAPGMDFKNPHYPILQEPSAPQKTPPPKLNIVILTLEGFSAKFVGAVGGIPGITPHLDRLAAQGMLFTNFLAVGQRSTDAMAAIGCSIPPFDDLRLLESPLHQDNFRCVGTLLKETGYSTLFLHGAKTGSLNLNFFAQMAGFENYVGKEKIRREPGEKDSSWGAYDHIALRQLNAELRQMKEPFLALWFSLTSHTPFELPDEKYLKAAKLLPNRALEATLSYVDESLGDFFTQAEKEPFFKNTIFFILPDHTQEDTIGTYDQQHIFLIIYSPGRIPPRRVESLSGQLDVLPTIVDLLRLNTPFHTFGRSLIDTSVKERFAYVERGGHMGWFEGPNLLLASEEGAVGLFEWEKDKNEKKNLVRRFPDITGNLKKELFAFAQTSKRLLLDNRLAPATTEGEGVKSHFARSCSDRAK